MNDVEVSFFFCLKYRHFASDGGVLAYIIILPYSDIRPPAFINGECPDNILETSISADHTAKVIWDIPYGEDNSKDPVKIAEVHGYEPGQIFKAGQYQIKYTIEDSSQNRGDSCTFLISINGTSNLFFL